MATNKGAVLLVAAKLQWASFCEGKRTSVSRGDFVWNSDTRQWDYKSQWMPLLFSSLVASVARSRCLSLVCGLPLALGRCLSFANCRFRLWCPISYRVYPDTLAISIDLSLFPTQDGPNVLSVGLIPLAPDFLSM